jgi:hypothetical protein
MMHFFFYFLLYVVWESTVIGGEKIALEILRDLHIFSTPEYEIVGFVIPFVCI